MPVFRLFLMSGDQYLSNVSHVNLKSKDRFYCHAAWIAEKLVDWYAMKYWQWDWSTWLDLCIVNHWTVQWMLN